MNDTTTPTVPRMPRPPARALPRHACDTHTHVFGPLDRFPFKGPSNYGPPLADPDVHARMLDTIGADRAILIQPAPYGTDAAALLNALALRPDRLRGVAVATADIADGELERLNAAGVRGLRFSEMRDPISGGRYKGSIGLDDYEGLASRMRDLGWVPHIWASCADLAELMPRALTHGLPFVIDHLAAVNVGSGVEDPAFQRILALLREGRIWVKLSLCRNSKRYWDFEDERPFHDALVAANPDRLLWGSDWPFVRMYENSPDVGQLIDLFDAWVGDDAIRRKVFVTNPASLYGFPQE